MRNKLTLLPFVVAITVISNLSVNAQSPIPDTALEDALLYRPTYSCSLAPSTKKIDFFMAVEAGSGHFADLNGNLSIESLFAKKKTSIKDFFDIEKNRSWTKLSRSEAEDTWGQPQPHCSAGASIPYFYTFDAVSSCNGERNIYHLDLRFAPDGKVFAYRVRGIGIYAPCWFVLADNHIVRGT